MSVRELGTRSHILAGALRDAERRDTIEHFTVAQIRRLSRVLKVDPQELLSDCSADEVFDEITDIQGHLSDDALVLLVEIHREECRTGYWSEAANCDQPNPATAELLGVGALNISDGLAVLDPRVVDSLARFGELPKTATRTTRISR
jgi:hypothetical protein